MRRGKSIRNQSDFIVSLKQSIKSQENGRQKVINSDLEVSFDLKDNFIPGKT